VRQFQVPTSKKKNEGGKEVQKGDSSLYNIRGTGWTLGIISLKKEVKAGFRRETNYRPEP